MAIDFLIQLIDPAGAAPEFDPGVPLGDLLEVAPGELVTFDVSAADPLPLASLGGSNLRDLMATLPPAGSVSLNVAGLPPGAMMMPSLPLVSAGDVSSTFAWLPASDQVGTHLVTFIVTDSDGLQQFGAVAVDVDEAHATPGKKAKKKGKAKKGKAKKSKKASKTKKAKKKRSKKAKNSKARRGGNRRDQQGPPPRGRGNSRGSRGRR